MPTDSELSGISRSSGEFSRRPSNIASSLKPQKFSSILGRFIRQRASSNPPSPNILQESSGTYFAADDDTDEDKLLSELKATTNLNQRIKLVNFLADCLRKRRLERLTEFWEEIEQVLNPMMPVGARQAGFAFMSSCLNVSVSGSSNAVQPVVVPLPLRVRFYEAIRRHDVTEDYSVRLLSLRALIRNGREIHGFEATILDLLLRWIEQISERLDAFSVGDAPPESPRRRSSPSIQSPATKAIDTIASTLLADTVALLKEVTRFHFVLFPDKEMARTVRNVCRLCDDTTYADVAQRCVEFMETLVPYGQVPEQAMGTFVRSLCRCVVTEKFQKASWNILKNLLVSHAAYAAMHELCRVIEDSSNARDIALLRGALFFLGMSTWGSQRVESLTISINRILSAIKYAAKFRQANLDYEVLINLGRLLKKYYSDLTMLEWELFFDILDALCYYIEHSASLRYKIGDPACINAIPSKEDQLNEMICIRFGDVLARIQTQYVDMVFKGPARRFLRILDRLSDKLYEKSALILLDFYRKENVFFPMGADDWLTRSKRLLLERWFRHETRHAIRLNSFRTMVQVCKIGLVASPEGVIEELVLPLVRDLSKENDSQLSFAGVVFLTEMTELAMESLHFPTLLERLARNVICECPQPAEPFNPEILRNSSHSPSARNIQRMAPELWEASPECKSEPASKGICRLLRHSLYLSANPEPCQAIFDQMLRLIRAGDRVHSVSRIHLLNSIFRLRVTLDHRVYILEVKESAEQDITVDDIIQGESKPYPPRESYSENYHRASTTMMSYIPQKEKLHDSLVQIMHSTNNQDSKNQDSKSQLKIGNFIEVLSDVFLQEKEWEVFRIVLQKLPVQLHDKHFFCGSSEEIEKFTASICKQISTGTVASSITRLPEGVKRQDLVVSVYRILAILLSFKRLMNKQLLDSMVLAFQAGIVGQSATLRPCVHALTLCLYEAPYVIARMLPAILARISRILSTPDVSIDLLEFLSALARLPKLTVNFVEQEHKMVFGVAIQYIKYNSALKSKSGPNHGEKALVQRPTREQDANPAFRQYVLIMAYHVINVWFLRIRLSERARYVAYISRGLSAAHEDEGQMDELTETCLDMLTKYSYADFTTPPLKAKKPKILGNKTKTWIVGQSVVSISPLADSAFCDMIIRRASGTTSMLIQMEPANKNNDLKEWIANITREHGENAENGVNGEEVERMPVSNEPGFFMLQLLGLPDLFSRAHPYLMPNDESTQRALSVFDRTPTVDFHKIGVVYVAHGQTSEREILSNENGSVDFVKLMNNMANLMKLKGSRMYTGGLDTENDIDGEFAYHWQEEATQMVFHTAILMPTNTERDPNCTQKKRHLGNDFVTIIYNDSPAEYRFDTLASQFNFAQVVVTPLRHTASDSSVGNSWGENNSSHPEFIFFRIQLHFRLEMPAIGPAVEPKIVTLAAAGEFIRHLALHANVYAQVFLQAADGRVEYVSNWRERLRQIKRLRERITAKADLLDFTCYT